MQSRDGFELDLFDDLDVLEALDADSLSPEVRWERQNPAGRVEVSNDGLSAVLWNFGVNSSVLKQEHVAATRGFAFDFARSRFLRQQLATVSIAGHASSSAGRAFNRQLSRRRASAVSGVFLTALRRNLRGRVRRGADGNFLARFQMNRLSVTGAGESRPAASNATPEGMARNRRVEIGVDVAI
jgi:outer membrane protein OmpA-like peptidoglycan-associated protein